MTWETFVQKVASRAGTSQASARRLLEAYREEVSSLLEEGEALRFPLLGTLDRKWVEERTVRSIQDGRKLALDGYFKVSFRPASALSERLAAKAPKLLKDPAHQKAWRLAEALLGDLFLYQPDVAKQISLQAESLEAAAAYAFGVSWQRARTRFDAEVPAEVRSARDYLLEGLRKRLASLTGE